MPTETTEDLQRTAERKVVLGAALATGGSLFCLASYNFVVPTIVISLGADETQSQMLRQLPGIGGLLAIFLAGVLSMRLGADRCLRWSGGIMAVGYAITLLSPNIQALCLGLTLAYVGKAAVIVITVSLLSSRLRGTRSRASGFAALQMVGPAVCVVVPIFASYIVDENGWRWVVLLWLLGAALVMFSAFALIPSDRPAVSRRSELWTSIAAGIVLVALTQLVRLLVSDDAPTWYVFAALGVSAIGALIVVTLDRKLPDPSISFSVLRNANFSMMLLVILLMPFANMWFYGTVGAQYIYGLTAFEVSLVFIPVQLAGVFGAIMASRLMQARGLTFTGTAAIIGSSVMCLLCMLQSTTISILVPLLILMGFSACTTGAAATLTNAIMNSAHKGHEGQASAFRTAAAALGSSLGTVFLSTIVFVTMTGSMTDPATSTGLGLQEARAIAQSVIGGASSEEVASQYSVPVTMVEQITLDEQQAAATGYQAQGLGSGVVLLVAAGLYYTARRRLKRPEEGMEERTTASA